MEVVVPPADVGPVAATDDPTPPTHRPSTLLAILSAAFAVVVVVCLVVLVVRYVNDTEGGSVADRTQQLFGGGDEADETAYDVDDREAVMSQADQFMLRVFTYGPSELDAQNKMPKYADRIREVITPKFAVDFDKFVTLAEQSVAQAGYARSAQLFSTGVDTIDDDTATVLVAGVFTSSYPDSRRKSGRAAYPKQPFRVEVTLVKIEGDWLVDAFDPVTDGTATTGGDITNPPATTPASPSTTPTKPTKPTGTTRTPSAPATSAGAKP